MDKVSDLARLESVVEEMLQKFKHIKHEKSEFESQVAMKNQIIDELQAKVNALTSDQESISSRVNSIISSIEEWEKGEAAEPVEESAEPETVAEPELIEPVTTEPEDEDEVVAETKPVQEEGQLFSLTDES